MRCLRLAPLPLAVLAAVAASCGGGGGGPGGAPGPGVAVPVVAPAPVSRLVLRVARVRGTELRFVERGSGTPVVLVHGSLETWESWLRQVDAFASTFRVIAYSRRYHPPNATRPDGQAYALALHADDLIALLEALGLERVHLVGSGYGAYVALLVTLRRPDLVRSLVLGEPPILPWLSRTPAGDSLRRTFEGGTVAPVRQALARGDSVEALRRFWDGVSGRPGRFDALPEPARAGLLRSALELRLEMSADPALYMPPLSCTDVGRIRNAVLVVIGERSPRLYRLVTEELARCLPAAEKATVPGAGYSSHADNPAAYDAVVFRFLTRN